MGDMEIDTDMIGWKLEVALVVVLKVLSSGRFIGREKIYQKLWNIL